MGLRGLACADSTGPRTFSWGINGHPLTQEAYWGNMGLQMKILKELGMGYYRVDMAHDDKGVIYEETKGRFIELMNRAAESGIAVIPILFPPDPAVLYALSGADTAYEKGLALGKGFADLYGKFFDIYEMGNENDANVLIPPAGPGSDPAQYDMRKLKILAGFFRGLSDGIRQVDAGAKLIISNSGWMHYAYFELLSREGVNFDIIGYHWYNDSRHLRSVLRILRSRFSGKPIWFTEINWRSDGNVDEAARREKLIKQYIRAIIHIGKNVQAFFFYELFDEPAIADKNESHFGVVNWNQRYRTISDKPLFSLLRKAIRQYGPPRFLPYNIPSGK